MKRAIIMLIALTSLGFSAYSKPYVYSDISAQYFLDAEEGYISRRENLGNEGARIQFLTKVIADSGTTFEIRARDYIDTRNRESKNAKSTDDLRIRGIAYLGDYQRIRMQYIESFVYREFEFIDFINVTGAIPTIPYLNTVELAPRLLYSSEDGGYDTKLGGLSLYTHFILSKKINFRINWNEYYIDSNTYRGTGFGRDIEVLINARKLLGKVKGTEFHVNIDGGLDNYYSILYKNFDRFSYDNNDSYSIFIMPTLDISYKNVYASLGFEYRNFGGNNSGDNKWRWQPSFTIGYSKEF